MLAEEFDALDAPRAAVALGLAGAPQRAPGTDALGCAPDGVRDGASRVELVRFVRSSVGVF